MTPPVQITFPPLPEARERIAGQVAAALAADSPPETREEADRIGRQSVWVADAVGSALGACGVPVPMPPPRSAVRGGVEAGERTVRVLGGLDRAALPPDAVLAADGIALAGPTQGYESCS